MLSRITSRTSQVPPDYVTSIRDGATAGGSKGKKRAKGETWAGAEGNLR